MNTQLEVLEEEQPIFSQSSLLTPVLKNIRKPKDLFKGGDEKRILGRNELICSLLLSIMNIFESLSLLPIPITLTLLRRRPLSYGNQWEINGLVSI